MQKFQRRRLPEPLPISLHRGRVYIVPTRFGFFFGAFLLVMLLGSLNYQNNLALLLCFLLAALILMAPIYTVRNLVDLTVTRIEAPPVFAGAEAKFHMTLVNPSANTRPVVWAALETEARNADVPGQGRTEIAVSCQTSERGWLSMKRTRLFTHYPFGLCYAWVWLVPNVRCLIYPRPETDGPGLPKGNKDGTGLPEHSGDEEWSGLRDYQAGDPARSIAWKVAARSDQLVTKTFAAHQSEEIDLNYAKLSGLDKEQRIARLARWVLEADKQGLHFALSLPHESVGPAHGPAHRHQCLTALALMP